MSDKNINESDKNETTIKKIEIEDKVNEKIIDKLSELNLTKELKTNDETSIEKKIIEKNNKTPNEKNKLSENPIKKEKKTPPYKLEKQRKAELKKNKEMMKKKDYPPSHYSLPRDYPPREYQQSQSLRTLNNKKPDFNISLDVCDNISLILKDKITSSKIELSAIEQKIVDNFLNLIDKKKLSKENEQETYGNNKFEKRPYNECYSGDNCIIWHCNYNHSDKRKKECSCLNKDNTCDGLHAEQALCKDPKHSPNCEMAHRLEDLKLK